MSSGDSRTGQRLDDYRLLRYLGGGSFGEVYLAEHLYRKTQVAIKILPRLSEADIPTFLNEARTIRLKHPSIVQVQDFGIADHLPFIVMDYAPNGTLRDHHPKGSRLPLEQIISYVKQIAAALQYAHDDRVIHRDIKPENILINFDGKLLVSDFGIATMAHGSLSQSTQELVGTAAYMAPEQIQGKPRFASDQYSLGVMAYEWLCGERPFEGATFAVVAQHITMPPPPLHTKMPAIFPPLEQVVMTTLAKDPKDRYPTIQAFATDLEAAFTQMQAAMRPAPALPVSSPPSRLYHAPLSIELTQPSRPVPVFPNPAPSSFISPKPAPLKSFSPYPQNRRRLVIVTLLLLLVLLLASGGFYLLNRSGNVDQKLDIVSQDIKNANTSLAKNDPPAALTALSQAQSAFPKDSLTTDQSKRLDDLRKSLASTLKQAYSHYNQQNNITDLSCAVTKTTITTEPTVSVNLKNLAVVKNGTKEFFYTLGDDHALYLFDAQMQQLSKVALNPDSYVEMIAGDNTRLIILTSQPDAQSPPRSYKLYTFQPDAQGNLPTGTEADIDKGLTNEGNFTPSALAAWGSDIFLALVSKATPSNIILLYYNLGINNQFVSIEQSTSTISNSANALVSMVAFEKHQLFLLDNSGGLKSVQFVKGSTPPGDVILQGKMPAPFNIDAQQYNAATPVPTPSMTNSSPFLQFSGATGMAAGTLSDDPDPHLFILDGTMNRILELKVVPSASVTSSITSATPTTVAGGGGAMASGLSMQLLNQFVSPSALYAAKSLVVDPSSSQNMLYVLSQDTQIAGQHTFLQINARQKNASCS
jgi:serine/threonine protein kinase